MLPRVRVLDTLESYYDTAPRRDTTPEEVGPFTLFVPIPASPWKYYARPRLGLDHEVTAADVRALREVQRQHGLPENLEWVHDTTPSLLAAARAAGLEVEECPLLVLREPVPVAAGVRVRLLDADDPDLGLVLGAVHAGFGDRDEVAAQDTERARLMMREGLRAVAGAFDECGAPVGGGSHGPRDGTTELAGIAVLPRARRQGVGAALTAALVADALDRGLGTVFLSAQDDAVARVYERVGFQRVGTACMASAAS
jgi:predicted GNAT family acetyltransferase